MDAQEIIARLQEKGVQNIKYVREEISMSCPLGTHNDSTPSAFLNPNKGLFYCFSCRVGLNLLSLFCVLKIPYNWVQDKPRDSDFFVDYQDFDALSFSPAKGKITYETGWELFLEGIPYEKSKIAKDYMAKRIGSFVKLPVPVHYHEE